MKLTFLSYSVKWALTALLAYIAANLLFLFLDIGIYSTIRFVVLMPAYVAVLVLALIYYRDKELKGFAHFFDLFKVGMGIFIILGIGVAIWDLIYPLYVDVEFYQKLVEQTQVFLSDKDLSKAEIEAGINETKLSFEPQKRFFKNIVNYTILGLILNVPISLILRKEKKTA